MPHIAHLPFFGIMKNIQLDVEEFLELEPVLCKLQFLWITWEMHNAQGIVERHKAVLLYDVGRQGLGDRLRKQREEVLHKLEHCSGVQPAAFHLLSGIIIGLQTHCVQFQQRCIIHIGVSDIHPAVEHGRLAEYYILLIQLQPVPNEFYAPEPHKVHKGCPVGEMCHKTARCTLAHLLK